MSLQLGRTVKQLKQEMSISDFMKYMAYDNISPMEPERMDFRFAELSSLIATMFGKKAFKSKEFMPDFLKSCKDAHIPEDKKLLMKSKSILSVLQAKGHKIIRKKKNE